MTAVFDTYAAYYDLLYRDKDYAGEAAYVDRLIQRHHPGARSVLELGCGTGAHALHLASLGYALTGVDFSERMVALATAKAAETNSDGVRPRFVTGDLRTFRAGEPFDAVLALFHVISYQIHNADLAAAMATAAAHLGPGGIFVFDCWYGPGVLTDPPVRRERQLHGDGVEVTRIAEPTQHPNENRVDVNYEITVERTDGTDRFHECHAMRYLFVPEVDLLLAGAGMERLAVTAWLSDSPPSLGTWNACFIARRLETRG